MKITTHFKTPAISKLGRPFWQAARQGKLAIQQCKDCGKFIYYPSVVCEQCLSDRLEWKEVSGRGTVESFTTVYRAFTEEFSEDIPYTVALVRLDVDVLLLTWLTDVEPDAVKIGMEVEVTFERVSDEISLHRFRPVG
jgi:uncharacterized OB-fold protein